MSDNKHTQPWAQMICYEMNFLDGPSTFYEEDQIDEFNWSFRFADRYQRANFQVTFDSEGVTPNPYS